MKETRWLMAVLTPKVQQCKNKLRSREWHFAKYSMQRLPQCPELDGLLAALACDYVFSNSELERFFLTF